MGGLEEKRGEDFGKFKPFTASSIAHFHGFGQIRTYDISQLLSLLQDISFYLSWQDI